MRGTVSRGTGEGGSGILEPMEIEILYEDENKLVINKPVDLVVNRAESIRGETVQDWVERLPHFAKASRGEKKPQYDVFFQRSGVCHRLDKETSGCLLIAKNPETMKYFLKLFKDRKIHKEYVALVHGKVEPKEGSVILPLRRSILEREKWQVHYGGKKAITYWKVEQVFDFEGAASYSAKASRDKNKLSLLKLDLKTGRTHQIRVHLSFLGWPIFSDERYLNKKQLEMDQKYLNHHFLHSRVLEFVDEKGIERRIEAPLPMDCQRFLEKLDSGSSPE